MKHLNTQHEQGFAHIVAIFLLVATIGAVGTTTFITFQQKQAEKEAVAKQALETEQAKQAKLAADKKALEAAKLAEKAVTKIEQPAQTTPSCALDATMYVTVKEGHALRSEKSLAAAKVVTAPYAAALKVGCKDGAWYKADYGGKEAYAYGEYLSTTKPSVSTVTNPTQAWCESHGQKPFVVYAAKSATVGFYHKANPTGSLANPLAYGTAMPETYCPGQQGEYAMPGYVLHNDAYYKLSDVSVTKP